MSTRRMHVEMDCTTCRRSAVHEIVYVGRLMITVRCAACGAEVPGPSRHLVQSWLGDLSGRLLGKGQLLLLDARRHPGTVARQLPGRLLRQPGKFVSEAATVLSRNIDRQ